MRIFTSWQDYPRSILGSAETPLCRWIEEHASKGETWIDIGAHHGVTSLALSRAVGVGGRVFAFEPVLSSAGFLARTREANALTQMTVVPLAMGNAQELTLVRVSLESKGMIAITPKMRAGTWAGVGEIVYEMAFDRIWPVLNDGIDRVDGIKVDVQGAESYVLRGLRETLERHKPKLVVEYHDYADLTEFLETLESVGYSRVGRDIDEPSNVPTSELRNGCNYEFDFICRSVAARPSAPNSELN
jgi:FkbM family methyltransferase